MDEEKPKRLSNFSRFPQATQVRPEPLVSWFVTHCYFQNTRLLPGTQKLLSAANTLRIFLPTLLGQTEKNKIITEMQKESS